MKTLQNYQNDKQSEAFDKYQAFCAFGEKQMLEALSNLPADTKITSLGHGVYCPLVNAVEFIKRLGEIYEEAIRADVSENGAEAIIQREYFNYECQIGETDDAREALSTYDELFPELFTEELYQTTFKKCWNLAVENDWF
jgi:hypothetical protein